MTKGVGVKFEISNTALLSGIETVFWVGDVTDYTINIWSGWINNKPINLLYTSDYSVNWDSDIFRIGGWAHISLIDENIIWMADETYYVEIDFNGPGVVYPFDRGLFSNSANNDFSYFIGNTDEVCIPLKEGISDAN
tara:strand:- start:363 stop:773 length:411 start_codon:yes stop_codon:yes gene_type:complete